MRRYSLFIICSLFASGIVAQTTVSQFPLTDVRLLPSRFQRNMQRDSAWIASIPVQSLLHSLRNTAGVFSGKEGGYTTVKRLGDWAYNKLKPLTEEQRTKMIRNEFGGFSEAMYNLYSITRDEKYLWVARFFYHNDKIDPLKQGNNDLGTNHANTFIPKLLGECRNYELFGQEDSRRAAETLFWTLVNDHAFVTGEVSDKEHLFKPETQSKHLTGYDGESCCTYNLLKQADRLFCYEPNSKIADYYERGLYNHLLGQQDTLSSMVCYFTPLMTGGYRLYSTRDSSYWCCVGSGFETNAKFQAGIYYKSLTPDPSPRGEGSKVLYVNLFIPSELNWDGIIVRQETSFPESNKTVLTASQKVNMKVRYPHWATYMKVNGKKVKAGADGYVLMKNVKKAEIEFGMTLHEETTKDDPTRVALLYGPIVLGGCLAEIAHPFSDPMKHNDYYSFDYGEHPDVKLGEVKHLGGLHFQNSDGTPIAPFYDMQHCRYVVYWRK